MRAADFEASTTTDFTTAFIKNNLEEMDFEGSFWSYGTKHWKATAHSAIVTPLSLKHDISKEISANGETVRSQKQRDDKVITVSTTMKCNI